MRDESFAAASERLQEQESGNLVASHTALMEDDKEHCIGFPASQLDFDLPVDVQTTAATMTPTRMMEERAVMRSLLLVFRRAKSLACSASTTLPYNLKEEEDMFRGNVEE